MRSKLKEHLPFLVDAGWPPSLVFAAHCLLSLAFNAYDQMPSLDVPMHLLGGLAIAYFFHAFIRYGDRLGLVRVGSRRAEMIMVFGLVAAATVVWELAEFLADHYFHLGAQPSVANTMKDQLMGLVGGAGYIALSVRKESPREDAEIAIPGNSDYRQQPAPPADHLHARRTVR
ncbi:MAG: hypothetical protein NUW21_06585 [Elusimicrobia bacterium]|nr:hypothetical protein [Elusimicrobiota bacterium]